MNIPFQLCTAPLNFGLTSLSLCSDSHFCYSDFNAIFSHIARLDADVISIEASKSSLKLLDVFTSNKYSAWIGPGCYDIHSPRVPPQQEIQDRISAMIKQIPADLLFINPDCGLKTRGWSETEKSLTNLVEAAKWAREVSRSTMATTTFSVVVADPLFYFLLQTFKA